MKCAVETVGRKAALPMHDANPPVSTQIAVSVMYSCGAAMMEDKALPTAYADESPVQTHQ